MSNTPGSAARPAGDQSSPLEHRWERGLRQQGGEPLPRNHPRGGRRCLLSAGRPGAGDQNHPLEGSLLPTSYKGSPR